MTTEQDKKLEEIYEFAKRQNEINVYYVGQCSGLDHRTTTQTFECKSIPGYDTLTPSNFCFNNICCQGYHSGGDDTANYGSTIELLFTYVRETGILTVGPLTKSNNRAIGSIRADIYCITGVDIMH